MKNSMDQWDVTGIQMPASSQGCHLYYAPICPDMLVFRDLGAADTWKGHAVRTFFRILSWIERDPWDGNH